MDPQNKYIQSLLSKGNRIFEDYYTFLSLFYKNINRSDIYSLINEYLKYDKMYQKRIFQIDKTLKQFHFQGFYDHNKELIQKCSDILGNISQSLDIYKSQLHDELCSLNRNNSLFGLRYNRYQTNGLSPLYVDIKT